CKPLGDVYATPKRALLSVSSPHAVTAGDRRSTQSKIALAKHNVQRSAGGAVAGTSATGAPICSSAGVACSRGIGTRVNRITNHGDLGRDRPSLSGTLLRSNA